MFDSRWLSGLAFGLVASLVLVTVVSVSLSEGPPAWWRHSGTIINSEDTLAQWLMMVWSLLAVIVSALAVYWVKKTFDVTQRMSLDTREIGEAQASAYASIGEAKVTLISSSLQLSVYAEVKNSGASPALDVRGEIAFCLEDGYSEVFSKEQQFYLGDIPSGGSFDLGGIFLSPVAAESAASWQSAENPKIYIAARIYGSNVFGKKFVVRRCFMRVDVRLNDAAKGLQTFPMADPFALRFIFGKFPTMQREPTY
jgi:hypothetical protein